MEGVGNKLGDVGRRLEVSGGFGAGAPAAEELVNGNEKLVLGKRLGRRGRSVVAVAFFKIAKILDGAEQNAKSREIDFGGEDGRFVAPDFAISVITRADDFLGGETYFGGIGGFVDDPQEADALGRFGESFLGEVVADFWVDW